MRDVGFFQIMAHKAGYHLVVSTAAWHMELLRGSHEEYADPDFVSHSSIGIVKVNESLSDPILAKSDITIALILAFATFTVSLSVESKSVRLAPYDVLGHYRKPRRVQCPLWWVGRGHSAARRA